MVVHTAYRIEHPKTRNGPWTHDEYPKGLWEVGERLPAITRDPMLYDNPDALDALRYMSDKFFAFASPEQMLEFFNTGDIFAELHRLGFHVVLFRVQHAVCGRTQMAFERASSQELHRWTDPLEFYYTHAASTA